MKPCACTLSSMKCTSRLRVPSLNTRRPLMPVISAARPDCCSVSGRMRLGLASTRS